MTDLMATVRVMFVGDPTSLITAYEDTASAAQASVDRLTGQASQATGALEDTGGAVESLSVKLEGIGSAADTGLGNADAALEGVKSNLVTLGTTADEAADSIGSAAKISAAEWTAAWDSAAAETDSALIDIRAQVTLLMAETDELIATVDAGGKEMAGSMDTVTASTDGALGAFTKFGKYAALALAALGIGAVDLGNKLDDATTLYDKAAENAGETQKQANSTLAAGEVVMQKLGFTATETAQGLQAFAVAGIKGKQANTDMGLAADIAREKNVSLASAVGLLTKVNAGSNRALTQMGVNLDIGSGKLSALQTATEAVTTAQMHLKETQEEIAAGTTKGVAASIALENAHRSLSLAEQKLALDQGTVKDITDQLTKRVGGEAEAFGTTLSGKVDIAKASFENMESALGKKLIPTLEEVLTKGLDLINWVSKTKAVLIPLAAVVGTVLVGAMATWVTGVIAGGAAALAAVAPTTAFGAAMAGSAIGIDAAAAPIAAIIAGLALLGIAIYELVTHWNAVWGTIKEVVADAVNFIKAHWETIVEIIEGPVGLIVMAWQHFHDQIIAFFVDIGHGIESAWDSAISFVEGIPGKIIKVFDGAVSWLSGIGKDIVSGLIKGISDAWGDVWSFIKSKLTGLMSSVLGFFGIHSPSTVFAGIGKNLMLGLAGGVSGNASLVHAALATVSSGITNASLGSLSVSPAAVASSAAAGGSSTPVVVEVHANVDGIEFAKAIAPSLVIVQQGRKRYTVNADLS